MAKCHPTSGTKSNGTLRKGYRWAKGRHNCPIKVK